MMKLWRLRTYLRMESVRHASLRTSGEPWNVVQSINALLTGFFWKAMTVNLFEFCPLLSCNNDVSFSCNQHLLTVICLQEALSIGSYKYAKWSWLVQFIFYVLRWIRGSWYGEITYTLFFASPTSSSSGITKLYFRFNELIYFWCACKSI